MIRKLLASLDATLAQAWYILATFTPVLPWRRILWLLAGAAMCAGSVMLTRSALQDIAHSYQSSSWPRTTGQVIEARLEQRGDDFRAVIRYHYQIGDADYSSETLSFDDKSSTYRAQAEATFESYPVGAMVQVSYHPSDPALACLVPGSTPVNAFSNLVASGLLLLLGGAVVRDARRSILRSSSPTIQLTTPLTLL